MIRYVLNYAEVDYNYTDIVFFRKCLYGNYDVNINDFLL